ncbi:Protein strawberry notch 1 [Orchesella cincta]|uniref:Protein strawberry notch 1 n=1 Tax=Orchesella cincta TaxID=48709 RepID=A0A1D2MTP0_ORCCI|nr:Protein strawberry notch 1 [Orchesella cincta]
MANDEHMGATETYAEYKPAKLTIGNPHPDSVVETASLASVPPPEISYTLKIPDGVIEKGKLSALQLEAIVYACQKHEQTLETGERAGYLIGDGAGVGKGRTIAGIILDNYIRGRKKAIWISVSSDLLVDAERDFKDIGASKMPVHTLSKTKYGPLRFGNRNHGVLFATYSALIGCSSSAKGLNTRLKQIIAWFGEDFDGVIVFDECHRAKNLWPAAGSKPTKTGQAVSELQRILRNARVVYASATGASEPRNMAYMARLGLWGPGTTFSATKNFVEALEKRGISAMELVAMDLKLRGAYLARQLSFQGVTFSVEYVSLTDEFIGMYNEAVNWVSNKGSTR